MKGTYKLANEIATHLMTMNFGDPSAELGDRLAIMKTKNDKEVSIGGRCYGNIVQVIFGHLRKVSGPS